MDWKKAIDEFNLWRTFKAKPGTVKGYYGDLKLFALHMIGQGKTKITDAKLVDVLKYFEIMRSLEWNENTFCKKAFAIRKFFEFYRRAGHDVINSELIPVPKWSYEMPRIATHEEVRKILAIIPKKGDHRHCRNLAVIRLLYDTGARVGEICSLNVEDLDLKNNTAQIRTEKARYRRQFRFVKWRPETTTAIKHWLKYRDRLLRLLEKDEPALFINLTKDIGNRLSIRSVEESLRRYSQKAKLKRNGMSFTINPHSLRHLKGRDTIQKGGDISDVANILGHTRIESSWIYLMTEGKQTDRIHKKVFGW